MTHYHYHYSQMDRNRDSITSFIFCLFSFIFLLRWTTIKHFPLSCLVVIMRVTCKLLSILSYHRRNKILGIKFHIKCVSLHHFIFRVQSERLGFLKENKSTRKEPVTLTRERGDELQWSISILKFQVWGPSRYQICEVGVMS